MEPSLKKTNSEDETDVQSNKKMHPLIAIILICLFGGGSYIFFTITKGNNDPNVYIVWFAGILFALLCLYILVNLLPECKLKKKLIIIIGLPISLIYYGSKYWTILLSILVSIIFIFTFQVIVFSFLNKLIITEMDVWYFIATFISLVIVSYLKPAVKTVLRIINLPKSEKREKLYQESLDLLSHINFRKIAYVLGFLVYFISALVKFSGEEIINVGFWIGIRDVALESFIAFLALDACISVVAPKVFEKKEN